MATQTSFTFPDPQAGDVGVKIQRLTVRQSRLERPAMMDKLQHATQTENMETMNQSVLGAWWSFVNAMLQSTVAKPVAWWCSASASEQETLSAYEAFMNSDASLFELYLEHTELVNAVATKKNTSE